jgi:tight adherence protein C
MLPIVIALAAFGCVFFLVLALGGRRESVSERVASFVTSSNSTTQLSLDTSFGHRVLGPMTSGLVSALGRTAPVKVRVTSEKLLDAAGNPIGLGAFLAIRGAFLILLPILAFFASQGHYSGLIQIAIVFVAFIFGQRLPQFWIKRRIKGRVKQIEIALPDALDLVVICIEGGLSLDGALSKVVENTHGAFSQELARARNDTSLGLSRRDALRQLGERNNSPRLKTFTTTIVQAEQMGVSVGQALRTLAEDMRQRRRQLAEEAARKAPIKMIPVLVFFILPSLMIVILTPSVLSIMKVLGNGSY